MYYWKLWRETRVRFIALLILGLCVGWSVWFHAGLVVTSAGFEAGQALPAAVASQVWGGGTYVVMVAGGLILFFIGLVVGSSGLGEEMERGTAIFLLTRPRSRGYFVWSFWLASAFEVLAFTAITMISGYGTLFYLTRHAGSANFLLIGPTLVITGLVAIGLAQLLTTASRRSKNAVAGGLAFAVLYLVVAFVFRMYDILNVPTPLKMYSVQFSAATAFAMAGWLATALAFIGLSHLIVARMEI